MEVLCMLNNARRPSLNVVHPVVVAVLGSVLTNEQRPKLLVAVNNHTKWIFLNKLSVPVIFKLLNISMRGVRASFTHARRRGNGSRTHLTRVPRAAHC